jgi:Raf kinase inhibitor-like YbhB/YbcL family protein
MQLMSSAFRNGGKIPRRYTCDGENISPPLSWAGVPEGTHSLVLTCDDPDAPAGVWHHWAVYDIPPDEQGLGEHLARTALKQAINDFRKTGYDGPCPPRGHGPHRYRFRLFAVAERHLPVKAQPSCADVLSLAQAHCIAEAATIGLYER